ncbi:DUF6894 family protein [Methylobacterium sp. A54F]
MPRFFIDLHDGTRHVRDAEGFDLPDAAAAREKLLRVVSRVAQGLSSTSDRQDYLAVVRDENRKVLLRAHLSLDVEQGDAV